MNLREWALPVYTILLQLAVGSMTTLWVLRAIYRSKFQDEQIEGVLRNPVAIILITTTAAMGGSFFHLSRPFHSFQAVFNLGSSWLSREVFFTVLFWGAVVVLWLLQAHVDGHGRIKSLVGWTAVGFGITAIFCMANCYLLPFQVAWNTLFTPVSFYSSVILLGVSATFTMLTMDLRFTLLQNPLKVHTQPQIIRRSLPGFAAAPVIVVLIILAQYEFLINTLSTGNEIAQASARLYLGLYQPLLIFRLITAIAGAGVLVTAIIRTLCDKIDITKLSFHAYMGCLLLLISEILGRFLFYATHIRLGV